MLNILQYEWAKKGKNQATKNEAILKYLNKNDMLLQLPLKRVAINFDCKGS